MTTRTSWAKSAACRGADLDIFFPDPGRSDLRAQAIAICDTCPVSVQCLDEALQLEPPGTYPHGIRGGLIPRQRAALARERSTA